MGTTYTVVQFARHQPVGDALHRETWPMQALGALPDFRVVDVHYQSPYRYALALEADLLILGVILEAELVPILRWRRAWGKPTVLDLQNHILSVEPWTYTFEMRNDPVTQIPFLQLMGLVDLVQTTGPFLAKEYAPYCSRTVVFPNQLPEEMTLNVLPEKKNDSFVVGWAGSPSHLLDVACVAPAVTEWILAHERAVLTIMGPESVADLFRLPPAKKRFVPWGDMRAYAEFLRGVDIGLAPLHENPFNLARSDVKWLEYAAHGCVFVGQRSVVYDDGVRDGKTGFLFGDAQGMAGVLDRLYEDRSLGESVRRAAFEHVTKERTYAHHIGQRAEVYRTLLERKPGEGASSWNLHEQARLPGMGLPDSPSGYYPMKPQPDEEKALDAIYNCHPTPLEAIQGVEERYGEYHATCYARALLALRGRDLPSAEQRLRRALSLYPAAVESMALLGQILTSSGRTAEARRLLSCALEWNPVFMPAHSFLLRAVEQEKDWQAALAAMEQWEKHCGRDPRVHLTRARVLVKAGQVQEGLRAISDAMQRFQEDFSFWQRPLATHIVGVLRELDGSVSDSEAWGDLIVRAAELFPHGIWLAVRAGRICFERSDFARGAQILQTARERLVAWEWQRAERGGAPGKYRGLIESYRTACEILRGARTNNSRGFEASSC